MGPIYLPRKGDTLKVDESNLCIYRNIIQYEQKSEISFADFEYIFQNNYYFACGDNVEHSIDSRSWGFIPEEFIIGVATTITYSTNSISKRKSGSRFMKSIPAPFYE